jgi:hypothetical protein
MCPDARAEWRYLYENNQEGEHKPLITCINVYSYTVYHLVLGM